MKRLILTFAAVGVLAGTAPREANAQLLPHNWSAACVGGGLGCSQVDFFIELLDGYPAEIDYFWVELSSPGWMFQNPFWGGESEDAFGDPGFFPEVVNGNRIEGSFFFNPVLDPDFRFRAEMVEYQADISSFAFDCEGSLGGGVVFDCARDDGPVSVPEPGTVWLLGSGLVGMLGLAHRRRETEDEVAD